MHKRMKNIYKMTKQKQNNGYIMLISSMKG